MASILLKFVNRNGRFCICATVRGTTTRHYRTVEELVNPDFRKWDKIAQCFVSRKESDQANNRILNSIIDRYERLMCEREFNNSKELFDYAVENNRPKPTAEKAKVPAKKSPRVKTSEVPQASRITKKKEPTVGEWIMAIVEEIKNPSRLKPSASYQGYLTLFNKLTAEGNVIKMPISGVNDDTFVQLIAWLCDYAEH